MHWRLQYVSCEWMRCSQCRQPLIPGQQCATLSATASVDHAPDAGDQLQHVHIHCLTPDEKKLLHIPRPYAFRD